MLGNRSVLRTNREAPNFIAEGREFRNSGHTMTGKIVPAALLHISQSYRWSSPETVEDLTKFYDARSGHPIICFKSYDTIIAAMSLTTGDYWLSPENYSQTSGRHRGYFHDGIARYRDKLGKDTKHQNMRGTNV